MADKPTKSELAKLPGGDDFDVAGATSEEFDKHFEILERKAKIAGLSPVAVTLVETPATAAVASQPDPNDIQAVHKDTGERRYFTPATWSLLGDDKAGWTEAVDKPADLK